MSAILDWFYGADDLQSEGDALDAKLADMNAKDYGPGGKLYNAGNWEAIQQNLNTGATGNVSAQLEGAFNEGWEDGKKNVSGAVSGIFGTIGDGVAALLKGVPWWVWAGVLVYFLWPFIARRAMRA